MILVVKRRHVAGYLAANRTSGRVIICVNISGQKLYFEAPLDDALEVLTGRRAWTHIYKR